MQVEAADSLNEIKQQDPQLHETLLTHLEQLQQHEGNTKNWLYDTRTIQKLTAGQLSGDSQRECSPYADVILALASLHEAAMDALHCSSKGSIKRSRREDTLRRRVKRLSAALWRWWGKRRRKIHHDRK